MNDEQIKQRIAYLVEHGGVYEDPLVDIRRQIRLLFVMNAMACTMGVVGLILLLQ